MKLIYCWKKLYQSTSRQVAKDLPNLCFTGEWKWIVAWSAMVRVTWLGCPWYIMPGRRLIWKENWDNISCSVAYMIYVSSSNLVLSQICFDKAGQHFEIKAMRTIKAALSCVTCWNELFAHQPSTTGSTTGWLYTCARWTCLHDIRKRNNTQRN